MSNDESVSINATANEQWSGDLDDTDDTWTCTYCGAERKGAVNMRR